MFPDIILRKNQSTQVARDGNPPSGSSYSWKFPLTTMYTYFSVARIFNLNETGTVGRTSADVHASPVRVEIQVSRTASDFINIYCPDYVPLAVSGLMAGSSGPSALSARGATASRAPARVIATIRKHRGIPFLELPHDPSGGTVAYQLRPHGGFFGPEPVHVGATVLSADRLEFDLSEFDLEAIDLDALDLAPVAPGESTAVTIHVCSDTIVLIDRSARMLESAGSGGSRWSAAVRAANLFVQLNALAVPDLVTANVDLPVPNRLTFGTFYTDREAVVTLGELEPGSHAQCFAVGEQPETYYGSALTEALERAACALPSAAWRKRHIVVVTAGLDEADSETFDRCVAHIPTPKSDPEKGVHVHVIVVGRPGETEDSRLWRLARSHSGRYFNLAGSSDGQGESALVTPFLNVLQDLLPVQVMSGANERALMIEDGVDHVLFAGRAAAGCCDELFLENAGVTTRPRRTSCDAGLTFSDTYLAVAGTWRIPRDRRPRPLFALAECRLDFRCRAVVNSCTQVARLEATLRYRGDPVSGASVRAVAFSQPAALGAEMTRFAREGGLAEDVAAAHLRRHRVLFESSRRNATPGVARRDRGGHELRIRPTGSPRNARRTRRRTLCWNIPGARSQGSRSSGFVLTA